METVASKKNQNNHVQNSHYIRTLYWVGRLSFSRFSLAIQTLATAVSLAKEKKVLSLFFLLLFMTINCCTIQQLSLIQRIIDADMSSLQNGFAGNLAWFSVSVRGHHGWSWGENLRNLGHQIFVIWICVTNPRNGRYNNLIPKTFSAKIPLSKAWKGFGGRKC